MVVPAVRAKTEVHDGLEFVVPTWDPTPKPWNDRGSWVKDPEAEARVVTAILAAVPDHEALVSEALTAEGDGSCHVFWGSHGCSLTAGHRGLHVCRTPPEGVCSAGLPYGEADTLLLWWADEERGLRPSFHHWRWFR